MYSAGIGKHGRVGIYVKNMEKITRGAAHFFLSDNLARPQ